MSIGKTDYKKTEEFQQFTSRIMRYCDNQDRSPAEVFLTLKSWKCNPEWIQLITDEMQDLGFINETRFARSFARGKFRIKGWGKLKIMAALYQQKIPHAIINEALAEINEKDYLTTLADILEKKWKITGGETTTRINKTASYAIKKGYESTLVFEVIETINKK